MKKVHIRDVRRKSKQKKERKTFNQKEKKCIKNSLNLVCSRHLCVACVRHHRPQELVFIITYYHIINMQLREQNNTNRTEETCVYNLHIHISFILLFLLTISLSLSLARHFQHTK